MTISKENRFVIVYITMLVGAETHRATVASSTMSRTHVFTDAEHDGEMMQGMCGLMQLNI